MANSKSKKQNTKQLGLQKRKRRQWLTFIRMIRYGINNFSRNAWLTIAATAVMTITLLIVFMTLAARNTITTTVDEIRGSLDYSLYVKTNTTDEQAQSVIEDLNALPSVVNVEYESPKEARANFAKQRNTDPESLKALNLAINKFDGSIKVNLSDPNDRVELETFVESNENYKAYRSDREPSYSTEKRTAIDVISNTVRFADQAGLIASVVFVIISSLIVFNTIRMAIFNRKEEIQMMKLIGADRSFIRGPFIVEAMMYGFMAAIFATGLGFLILHSFKDSFRNAGIAIGPTIDFLILYSPFVLLGMIGIGSVIGVGSSLLATRKYLKI